MELDFLLAVTKLGKETRVLWFDWNWLVAVGLLGTSVFSARFIVQWRASEKAGESVIPISFWYLSIIGSLVTGFYFLAQRDPVGVLGYLPNSWIYVRNLILIKRKQRAAQSVTAAISDDSAPQKQVEPATKAQKEASLRPPTPVSDRGFFQSLIRPWPLTIIFFLVTLFLTTRDNQYPFYYEKDAHSKVRQVLTGERNFFHPLLMLNGTDAAMRFIGLPRTEHSVVVTGRWVMALCTSAAVAAFAMLAYRLRGPLTAVSVGVLVMTHNLVFELAHFFKEDPALLMGLALSFLAMQLFWEKRTASSAAWLGAACALAVSGKYVGIAAFVLGLVLLFLAGRRGEARPGRWFAFILTFVALTLVINYQVVLKAQEFVGGFETEIKDVTRASKRKDTPHIGQMRDVFDDCVHPLLLVLAALQIAITVRRKPRVPVEWFLFIYPLIFTVVLLYSPRLFTRHFLPVIAFTCVLAGFAIPPIVAWIWARLQRRVGSLRTAPSWSLAALTVVAIFLVFREAQHPMLWKRYKAFAKPTREQLIGYINAHLPADAVIAADQNTFLVDNKGRPRADLPVHCKVIVTKRMADFESVQALRDQGVTHIALHGRTSPRLFPKAEQALTAGREVTAEVLEEESERAGRNYLKNQDFYSELEASTEQLAFVPNGRIAYIAPAVKILRLKPRNETPEKAATVEKVSAEAPAPQPASTN